MKLIDRLILTMDNNETPLNIYLDMSKAFDTIDHTILINKLTFYGIHGVALDLIKSYLKIVTNSLYTMAFNQVCYPFQQEYLKGLSLDLYCLSYTLMISRMQVGCLT